MTWRTRVAVLLCALAACPAASTRAGAAVYDDAPAIAARGAGDMRAFIRGSDGALWTRSWDGSSWSAWSSLGGVLTSGPAASARPNGDYDVVVRGTDGGYHHRAFTPGEGWSGWAPLGGSMISRPASPIGRARARSTSSVSARIGSC